MALDDFNFAAPGTTGGAQQTIPGGAPNASLWDTLVGGLGALGSLGTKPGAMPGTTIGQPAGAAPMPGSPVSPMIPQTQMPPPSRTLFSLPQPAATGTGNSGLMAQYMALQQLMRGA
jgi:hypothetical protein